MLCYDDDVWSLSSFFIDGVMSRYVLSLSLSLSLSLPLLLSLLEEREREREREREKDRKNKQSPTHYTSITSSVRFNPPAF